MTRFKNYLDITDKKIISDYLNNYIKASDFIELLKTLSLTDFSNLKAQCLKDFGITKAGFKLIGNTLRFYYNK